VLLTVYIPSFNRATRLHAALMDLFKQIKLQNLEAIVQIIVGDNCSPDETQNVCLTAKKFASRENISFAYFRNPENLGFSGNIFAGISHILGEWVMFLSDDDILVEGVLANICFDLQNYIPSVALYNFAQPPFDFDNPLIGNLSYSRENSDYAQITSLISWPKLTGVVLKSQPLIEHLPEIKQICNFSKYFPHVTIAAYVFSQTPGLLKSSLFVARPDEDFQDHINYLPYIGEYLVLELDTYRQTFDSDNASLMNIVSQLLRTNILDESANSLIGYYLGKNRLTRRIKSNLINNLVRFATFKSGTKDGLLFAKPSKLFYAKLLLLPIISVSLKIASLAKFHKIQLMDEGF
jgi:glycosyltransferase involved in cell wall biosynthesis